MANRFYDQNRIELQDVTSIRKKRTKEKAGKRLCTFYVGKIKVLSTVKSSSSGKFEK